MGGRDSVTLSGGICPRGRGSKRTCPIAFPSQKELQSKQVCRTDQNSGDKRTKTKTREKLLRELKDSEHHLACARHPLAKWTLRRPHIPIIPHLGSSNLSGTFSAMRPLRLAQGNIMSEHTAVAGLSRGDTSPHRHSLYLHAYTWQKLPAAHGIGVVTPAGQNQPEGHWIGSKTPGAWNFPHTRALVQVEREGNASVSAKGFL
jgi:hypothetical protein